MKTVLRFWPYLRPHSRRLTWALAAMCAVAAFNGGAVLLLKPVVDRIFIERDLLMLGLAVAGLPLLVSGKTAVSYAQNYLMSWIGQAAAQRIREDLFRALLALPVESRDHRQANEVLSRVTNDLTVVQSALVSAPLYLVRDTMTLFVLAGSLVYLDWRFAFIALLGAPLASVAFLVLSRKMRRASLQSQGMNERLTDRFEQSLRELLSIKTLNYESGALEKFQEENASFFSLMMRYLRATALAAPLMELCGAVVVAALIGFGGTAVIAGRLTPGAFFAFLGAFFSAVAPAKNLARTNSELQRALASAQRIFELLDQCPGAVRRGAPFAGLRRGLRLEGVRFRYPGAGRDALVDADLELERGARLALFGPAGSGKSTLVRLLLLLHPPTAGRVLLDGQDGLQFDDASVRARMGLVTGRTLILRDTLWANIALARKGVSEDHMERVCAAAGLNAWAASQPEGLRALVDGASLGCILRQRISLARLALQEPDVIFLDEAADGLDAEAREDFLRRLAPLLEGRTVLCAGQQMEPGLSLSRALTLRGGRIVTAEPAEVA